MFQFSHARVSAHHALLNPGWPEANFDMHFHNHYRVGKENLVNHALALKAPTQKRHMSLPQAYPWLVNHMAMSTCKRGRDINLLSAWKEKRRAHTELGLLWTSQRRYNGGESEMNVSISDRQMNYRKAMCYRKRELRCSGSKPSFHFIIIKDWNSQISVAYEQVSKRYKNKLKIYPGTSDSL